MRCRARKCLLAHGKQDLEEVVSGSGSEDFTIWSPTRRASRLPAALGLNQCFLTVKDKANIQSAEFLTIPQSPSKRRAFSMAHKSQAGGIEKNGSLSSILYCKSDLKEGSLQWMKEPLNGQVLMVLSMDNNCSATSFDMELCAEKLKSLGVQVAADQWRRLIQDAVLKPEVRRYMFYNSRAFQIAIAVVFYMSLWTNIYSTVQLCSFGRYWEASVLVTLAAVAVTVVVILVIDRRQRKSGLRHSLDQLCVVMEAAVQPDPGTEEEEEASREESPLLSSGVNLHKEPVTCNELLRLVPEGPPEVMAQQLLVIFSGCYVRLLVTGQLPRAVAGGHLEHSSVPCLCQFIETTALNAHQSWFTGR
ncbi:transmembrane protein 268 isoform X3 [Calonectris borealis]|uniref:transmembrane protein 268 isoform X3 n=1 Tax=Calonectris borealis TaxID=1323832 RepID=UPI003F4B8925